MKLKVLTAYSPQRPDGDDFVAAEPGSLCVLPTMLCDNKGCGCDRAFISVTASCSTTTVIVTEIQITRTEIAAAMDGYIQRSWPGILDAEDGRNMFEEATRLADHYPVGMVLRIKADGNQWLITSHPAAA